MRKATEEKNKTVRRISGMREDMDDADKSLLSNADINKTDHHSAKSGIEGNRQTTNTAH